MQPANINESIKWDALAQACTQRWRNAVTVKLDRGRGICHLGCAPQDLADVCGWLFADAGYVFATMVVEEQRASHWSLTYVFYDPAGGGWVQMHTEQDIAQRRLPSVSHRVHAADWHEREIEDLFGLEFEGHPRLGEFVLHEEWPEGVNPMRKEFDPRRPQAAREREPAWQPPTIVEAPGAFAMPIGPVFSDFAESAHFLLETVGEDVIVTIPRFFYKYRGVEKIAEGQNIDQALLLAERFSGSSAFAHGLAFCQAVEEICAAEVPPRARMLRTALAELERLRHHTAAITAICGSTALAVAESQAAILEEDLLRLSGGIAGHRYLFGVLQPGGLARDIPDEACRRLAQEVDGIARGLQVLNKRMLQFSSSFLDRLEDVGIVRRESALSYGLVGPVARACGIEHDLRKLFPYAGYATTEFSVPTETEGDGYARLRVLFQEAAQASAIIQQAVAQLPQGPVAAPAFVPKAGAALAAVEAPIGAAFHWLRLGDDGKVDRYRLATPSFTNWHGFPFAAENFAFQDFPIILASFALSNVECDR
jgi:Ni,Fe-hydrogenase III large subunit/Ni,Fe-hydrogenase III component G